MPAFGQQILGVLEKPDRASVMCSTSWPASGRPAKRTNSLVTGAMNSAAQVFSRKRQVAERAIPIEKPFARRIQCFAEVLHMIALARTPLHEGPHSRPGRNDGVRRRIDTRQPQS